MVAVPVGTCDRLLAHIHHQHAVRYGEQQAPDQMPIYTVTVQGWCP